MELKGRGAGGPSQDLKEGRRERCAARAGLAPSFGCALLGCRWDPEDLGHLLDDRLGMDGISGEASREESRGQGLWE